MPKFGVGTMVASRQDIKKAVIEDGRFVRWIRVRQGDVGRIASVAKGSSFIGRTTSYMVVFGGCAIQMAAGHMEAVDDLSGEEISGRRMKHADPDAEYREADEDDSDQGGY